MDHMKQMFPANLCMGSHMPNKAKTFIPVLVSKIEQKTNFILVKTSVKPLQK